MWKYSPFYFLKFLDVVIVYEEPQDQEVFQKVQKVKEPQ